MKASKKSVEFYSEKIVKLRNIIDETLRLIATDKKLKDAVPGYRVKTSLDRLNDSRNALDASLKSLTGKGAAPKGKLKLIKPKQGELL